MKNKKPLVMRFRIIFTKPPFLDDFEHQGLQFSHYCIPLNGPAERFCGNGTYAYWKLKHIQP